MRDTISIGRANQLHPAVRDEVIKLIDEIENAWPQNRKIRIVQGLRTIDEQNALYAQGRSKGGAVVTNARGGSSFHNYGLAFDFAIMYDKDNNGTYEELSWDIKYDSDHDGVSDWRDVVNKFKAAGWEWGGDWKSIQDEPHLQKSYGYGWRELYDKYALKNFIADTEYVTL